MRSWESVQELGPREHVADGMALRNEVFLVRGAVYQPRWSLEIAEVGAFERSQLPPDLSPWARRVLVELSW